MAWLPQLNAPNLRAIADNLIAYWKLNQEDAFAWAGDAELPPIKEFLDNIEDDPGFPAVALVNDVAAIDYVTGGTVVNAGYQPTFDLMVVGPDPKECVRQARVYVKALISMWVNCPDATLVANAGVSPKNVVVEDVTSNFLEMMIHEDKIDFMQRVSIQATVRVEGSIFTGG